MAKDLPHQCVRVPLNPLMAGMEQKGEGRENLPSVFKLGPPSSALSTPGSWAFELRSERTPLTPLPPLPNPQIFGLRLHYTSSSPGSPACR